MTKQNAYQLLGIVQDHAPNAKAQEKIATIYRNMIAAGESIERVELELAQILVDGLKHDNWPWND